ncbi:uncharacterized protein LOC109862335 [Pseudomyrmex gracilis]|uniref:uncharacterized protein LOC109862335 n=1 Tax=Pseudomyrmex gracilis TaxID=219809 RepID=UPI0009951D07|nr:uncharacterized protein LOC109862335 [Pseudomyrmex gracilis]
MVLCTIIEKCQREQRVDGNSNILCNIDLPKAKCTTTEHSFEEEATNHAFCHLECSNDNGALMAGKNKDDCDFMSFMIEERIEEVTTITSDNKLRGNNEFGCTQCVPFPEFGMDIIDPPQNSSSPSSSSESLDNYSRIKTRRVADHTMNLVLSVESWKDNWLFQKKRTSESQSDPVIMLVPSSSADYKALIGDRDAEDTSDLSECSSTRSDEEIEKELLEAINNVIPKIPETSECNAEVNQEVPSIETQFDKEVVTCHTNTNIEKIESVCEKRKKDDKDKTLEILEEKTVKDEENERKRNKGSLLITIVKEEKAKEKFKDTECDTKTIEIKSSVNDVKNIDFENLSEKNDRMENIMEENEEQRESEYTEHYDTAIQRHLDSLTKVEICSEKSETSDNTKQIACTQHGKPENEENNLTVKEPKYSKAHIQLSYATIKENHIKSENDQLSTPPRPGTIAEREHKKWENAPPIENNPYSEESIRKRCLERQYSRNSEIPSVHYKLTKLNEVNLDALLLPERLDIKRFERDYYINQSKSASKEREEWAKLATSSVSSRPNISLSQWSSDEQQHEQQVSHHELKRFESASLRGSLSRQCCRDPCASAHFAINPLLYLKPAQTTAIAQSRCENDNDMEQVRSLTANVIEDATKDRKSEISIELNIGTIFEEIEDNYVLLKSVKIGTKIRKLMSTDWNRLSDDESVDHKAKKQIVPRYDNQVELLGNRSLGDENSGMYSISSRYLENSDQKRWRQLYQIEETDSYGNKQISSIGKKFWTIGGYKYNTFGGIRI